MPWMTPKTNWQSEENYNFEDWNRVLNNMNEVYSLYQSMGYSLPIINFNDTISVYGVIKYLSDVNSIETRLEQLRTNTISPLDWEASITWTNTTIFSENSANRWERNTQKLWDIGNSVLLSFRRCGAFICGEGGLPT